MPPSTRLSREEVVHRIRLLVTRRQLLPGERIGTERALAQAFGVSRFELRAALEQLESTHEIVRRIGRNGGVIVSDGRFERNLNTLESLAHMAKRQGCELTCALMRAAVTSRTKRTCASCGCLRTVRRSMRCAAFVCSMANRFPSRRAGCLHTCSLDSSIATSRRRSIPSSNDGTVCVRNRSTRHLTARPRRHR